MTSEILTLFLAKFRSKSSKRRLRGSKPRTVSANCPTASRLCQLLSPQPCCPRPARAGWLTPLHSPRFSPRRPAPLSPLWRAREWRSRYSRGLFDALRRYRQPDVSVKLIIKLTPLGCCFSARYQEMCLLLFILAYRPPPEGMNPRKNSRQHRYIYIKKDVFIE